MTRTRLVLATALCAAAVCGAAFGSGLLSARVMPDPPEGQRASDGDPVHGGPPQHAQPRVARQPVARRPLTRPLGAPDPAGPLGAWATTGTTAVALTFDDGPDPHWTPVILSLLRRYRIKATFCMIGYRAAEYPQLLRAIARDGHTLCNHTWRHDLLLGSRPAATIRADLRRTTAAIHRAVPATPVRYFRQPGGLWRPGTVAAARRAGMVPLHWSVDPQDWRRPGAAAIRANVTRHTGPGSIILLHDGGDGQAGTVAALRYLLPRLAHRFALTALPSFAP